MRNVKEVDINLLPDNILRELSSWEVLRAVLNMVYAVSEGEADSELIEQDVLYLNEAIEQMMNIIIDKTLPESA